MEPPFPMVAWITRDEGAQESEHTPEENSGCHQILSGVSVTKVAKEGRKEHVREDKGSLQDSSPRVVGVKLLLHFFENAGQCQPVHVVDEVDIDQHCHGHPLPRRDFMRRHF